MTTVRVYFDGRTWDRRSVLVRLAANGDIHIDGEDIDLLTRLDEVRVSERLADIPRHIHLPGGGACEVLDNSAVDSWLDRLNAHRGSRFLHRLDTSLWASLAAIAIVATIAAPFMIWGVPGAAERAVQALPMSVDEAIGRDSLAVMDRVAFSPSRVDEARRNAIRATFDEMVHDMQLPMGGELLFRRGDVLGANAFALAGNTVIITDELIALAEHDEEIIAVLAHELGHVQHRHTMKHIARNALAAVLWAAVLGDVSAVAGVAASMPAILDSLRHSRAFERQADSVARDYLDSAGIARSRLADLLVRLTADCPECQDGPAYLSSHPPVAERVESLSPAAD